MSVDLHPDWGRWTDYQRSKFMKAHNRNKATRARWLKILKKRAATEQFKPGRLEYRPHTPPVSGNLLTDDESLNETAAVEASSMYVARVSYGPLVGSEVSSVNIYKYDRRYLQRRFRVTEEDGKVTDIVDSIQQFKGGPKRFLWSLFNLIGRYHGDCVIYMQHNGSIIRVDKDDFEAWARAAQKDPVTALLEVRNLLPDKGPQ